MTCFPLSSNYGHVISAEITAIAEFCDYQFALFAIDRLLAVKSLKVFHAVTVISFAESVNDFRSKFACLTFRIIGRFSFMARIKTPRQLSSVWCDGEGGLFTRLVLDKYCAHLPSISSTLDLRQAKKQEDKLTKSFSNFHG
jgi:hypothetical protein